MSDSLLDFDHLSADSALDPLVNARTPALPDLTVALDRIDSEELARSAREILEAETSAHTRRALIGDLRYFLAWLIARYPKATGLSHPLSVDLRDSGRVVALFRALPAPTTSDAHDQAVRLVLRFLVDHTPVPGAQWPDDGPEELDEVRLRAPHPPAHLPENVERTLIRHGFKRFLGAPKSAVMNRRLASLSTAYQRLHHVKQAANPVREPAVRALARACQLRMQRLEPSGKKAALTRDWIDRLLETIDASKPAGLRDRAMILFAFASGGRRREELSSVRIEDLQRRENDGRAFWMARIEVAKSRGRQIEVPVRGLAATALSEWLDWLRAQGVERGAVFRRLTSSGKPGAGLKPGSFYQILVDRCAAMGEEYCGVFSPHSLRSGFMTEARKRDVRLEDAMALSGHRSVATAMGYYRAAEAEANPAGGMMEDEDESG